MYTSLTHSLSMIPVYEARTARATSLVYCINYCILLLPRFNAASVGAFQAAEPRGGRHRRAENAEGKLVSMSDGSLCPMVSRSTLSPPHSVPPSYCTSTTVPYYVGSLHACWGQAILTVGNVLPYHSTGWAGHGGG